MVKVKYIWFFLSFLCTLASCKKNNSECHNMNYIDNFEICTLSPPLSKYCYVIIHNNASPDTSDTIQIYKTESNQIMLFYRKHGLDTIFLCDRWNNTRALSSQIPIEKIEFNDSRFFSSKKNNKQYMLKSEYIQICIPEIKDILPCY